MRGAIKRYGIIWIAAFVAATILAAADSRPVLSVLGDVPNAESYSLDQLQQFHSTNATVRDHDGTTAEYTGVAIEELLRRAGAPLGERLRGPALGKAVVVHAADRYQAVFSLAELDPEMSGHFVLLAWSRNGQPLPPSQGPLRIIVPSDKRQARWVRQVTAIEVVSIDRPAITNASPPPQ